MEKYAKLKDYSPRQFRRLIGVQRETFEKMVQILRDAQNKRYKNSGRKGGLELEDKLLMALEYLREYRKEKKAHDKKPSGCRQKNKKSFVLHLATVRNTTLSCSRRVKCAGQKSVLV